MSGRCVCEDFHHPGLPRKIKSQLKTCDKCQRNEVATRSSLGINQRIIITEPFDAAFVNFYGPLPTSTFGYRYVLVGLEGFIKYVRMNALRNQTTRAAVVKIFMDYILKFFKLRRIVTDHWAHVL